MMRRAEGSDVLRWRLTRSGLLPPEPDLKKRIRVHLLNAHGLDEAGIDGGGIFREFLNELLKSGFNPNQGFFRTTNEALLYPSPTAHMLVGDSFTTHYYFLGRILGKVSHTAYLGGGRGRRRRREGEVF